MCLQGYIIAIFPLNVSLETQSMKSFHQFRSYLNDLPMVSEEIHQAVQAVLDADHIPVEHKLNHVSGAIKRAIKSGEDTGLQDSKPKKGSSRAVFFPKEPTKIHLDGKEAHVHTALKVAFPGQLDKYNKSGALLGEHQNMVEGDHFINHHHNIIREVGQHEDGTKKFETNKHGVLAPMIHSHEEGHHVLMGKVDPIKAGDFKSLTKTTEHPKGISHDELYDHLNHHYAQAHGQKHYGKTSEKRLSEIDEHPLVENMHDYMGLSGAHPGDLNKRNMGVWTHPHTGEKHIVVSDYGFTGEVAKHYNDARKNQIKATRGY
jgi:hypothetical protein